MDGWTDRQTDKQTDRLTNGQTDSAYKCRYTVLVMLVIAQCIQLILERLLQPCNNLVVAVYINTVTNLLLPLSLDYEL